MNKSASSDVANVGENLLHSIAIFLALGKPLPATSSLINSLPDGLDLAELQMRLTC